MSELKKKTHFDIVLVTGLARSTYSYLSIIKELSSSCKVAVFKVPLELPLNERTPLEDNETIQEKFLKLCKELGAKIISECEVDAKLAVYPQMKYNDEAKNIIHKYIHAEKQFALMNFPRAGEMDDFIFEFNISKLLVIHKRFYKFLLEEKGCPDRYKAQQLIEIGHPFKKYPLFSEVEGDYLIAIPTYFSFPHEKDKWQFFETVLKLFKNISENETVLYKEHNGQKADVMAPLTNKQEKILKFFNLIPHNLVSIILKNLAKLNVGIWSNRAGRFYTYYLYSKVKRRIKPLSSISPFHFLAMEVFLPGIKKGVIGGLSNSIWQTLFYELPFFNCVEISSQKRGAKDKLYYQDAKSQLELNLKFFYVPYCKGELGFDTKYFDIVDQSCKDADLVTIVKKEISS